MFECGLLQVELAERVGVSPSYVSRIMNGRVELSNPEVIDRIAGALGVTSESVTGGRSSDPVRVAVPPHLWSAPLLLLVQGEASAGGRVRLEIQPGDQSFTGRAAVAALRAGLCDLALGFRPAVEATDDTDLLALGSLCAGTDYLRLLVRSGSGLLRRIGGDEAAARGGVEQGRLRVGFEDGTIASEYVRRLEDLIPEFRDAVLVEREDWLDVAGSGEGVDVVVTWDPVASALTSIGERKLVDVLDRFGPALPRAWLPDLAEYHVYLRRGEAEPARVRSLIGALNEAVIRLNHLVRQPRMVLEKHPLLDHYVDSVRSIPGWDEARLRAITADHLRTARFQLRLRPELITAQLL